MQLVSKLWTCTTLAPGDDVGKRICKQVRLVLTLWALQTLSNFTALEHLSVEDQVTDEGLRALQLANTCSAGRRATLLTLRSYDTTLLTDQGLLCLAALRN